MAIVTAYDAAGNGINLDSGGGTLGGGGESTFVGEQSLGGGFYLAEYRTTGISAFDSYFIFYYYNSFNDQGFLEKAEFYNGSEISLLISETSLTLSELVRDGFRAVLSGNDTISGNSFDDRILGLTGNDLIYGDAGNDTLIGQENNDTIFGGVGNDSIDGNSENDLLVGEDGNDTLNGQEGFDELQGGFGNDILNGGSEDDLLFGEAGDDTLNGQQGNDELQAGLGNDLLNGGGGDDLLFGEAGDDILFGAEGNDALQGGIGNDFLNGSSGNDRLFGDEGNDTLYGNTGNDTLFGGNGLDTAEYFGNRENFSLILSMGDRMTLEDRRTVGDGFDVLYDVELLDFSDTQFNLTQFAGTTGLSAQAFESFVEIYIAYFNRAPDAIGLNFWGTAFANGTTLEEMATLFVDQDETRTTYPEGTSSTDFVTAVYDNLLGRIPDQAGFDFWVDMLNRSNVTGVTRDQFILEVLRGVQDDSSDRAYLDNKVDIGAYFAVHRGMSDLDNASAAMALFDGSQGSINQAVAAIDNYYDQALDPNNGEFLMQVVGVLDNPFAV